MATPYVCSESSRVGEMIITPVPEREGRKRDQEERGGKEKEEEEKKKERKDVKKVESWRQRRLEVYLQ